MGRDQINSGPGALLPSHRVCPSATIRASPFYTIPVHYLKRRGVLLLLMSMTVIAYLHYLYLGPSSLFEHASYSEHLGEDMDSLPDYMTVGRIREPPIGGPAPIHGVDEGGFEILEESFEIPNRFGDTRTPFFTLKEGQEEPNQKDAASMDADQLRRSIQFNFRDTLSRTGARSDLIKQRQTIVREMIQHAWTGYVKHAAPHDELRPVTADKLDDFHGWGSTLADGMDTLLLSGMMEEYQSAKMMFLNHARNHRWNQHRQQKDPSLRETGSSAGTEDSGDTTASEDVTDKNAISISFFDGVVRYLGGLLSLIECAEEKDPEVLKAAVELGDRLSMAFQGTNQALPANRIFANGSVSSNGDLLGKVSLAEVGTFQLEFRKLSQLSNIDKYRDIAQRNSDYLALLNPRVPGLYPAYFDPNAGVAHDYVASFGSLSDSFYEYLLKTFLLTGDEQFKNLYISSVEAMHAHLISRPHRRSNSQLVLGVYDTATDTLVPKMDHLSCFAPGLLAMGARVFGRMQDMAVARGLMETCYLSYRNSATGLGADEIAFLGTELSQGKEFEMPHPSGFYVIDPEYGLRPETIESLFVMYRITGDGKYQDYAWSIAQAIEKNCKTKIGYSTLANVMDASEGMTDRMPSYFLGQTLKYLYLIFSPPALASLDEYVFTTEGHLLKFPIP
ncbi:hypothetical protein BGZ68_002799 [Mortierella alpina]|nr:hypothetical protein BGZ68_002799 [Mortierella alpina]